MSLPAANNVYGTFICRHSLNNLADMLRYRMRLNEDQLWIKKSAYDGTQTLKIKTALFEFETTITKNPNEYFLNGAVAGADDDIIALVKQIHQVFQQGGYPVHFEIYDKNFNFVEAIS